MSSETEILDPIFSKLDSRGPEIIDGCIVLLAPGTVGVEDLANTLALRYKTKIAVTKALAPIRYMNRKQDFVRIEILDESVRKEYQKRFCSLYEDFLDASGWF